MAPWFLRVHAYVHLWDGLRMRNGCRVMASDLILFTLDPRMDPWKPRKTRLPNYQPFNYRLRTPVIRTETVLGSSSANTQTELRSPRAQKRCITEGTTFTQAGHRGSEVMQVCLEDEEVSNGDTRSHLQDISVGTVTSSPVQDGQDLASTDVDILDVADQEHAKVKLVATSYTRSPRQQVKKSQVRLRKQIGAKKRHIVQKPLQRTPKHDSAVDAGPITIKLWEPHSIPRERKHLNELDVCLTVYDQVMQDAVDKEERPAIKEILLKHKKITRKAFIAIIKEAHMLHLIQKRHQMEKTRQRKLRRAMQSTFKGLRKGAKRLLIKKEFIERSRRRQLDDLPKETDDDMFEQLKSLLTPFNAKEMLISETQSLSE